MIALARIGITQAQPFESTFTLAKMFLTEGFEILTTDVRSNGLDQKSWLKCVLVSNIAALGRDEITNSENFICASSFSLFFLNHSSSTIALALRYTFKRVLIKSSGLEICLPLSIIADAEFIKL